MNDAFHALVTKADQAILATFGQPVSLTQSDGVARQVQGIISKELMPVGQYEAMVEEMTVLTVAVGLMLKRGAKVKSQGRQWVLDRKISDDGQLTRWNLHED